MWRIIWYSSVMPFAPRMSRASRQHSSAIQQLLRLASETWKGCSLPLSFRLAELPAEQLRLGDLGTIQTSLFCTSWKPAIGLSNCTRSSL
jgi:hypothetical protein